MKRLVPISTLLVAFAFAGIASAQDAPAPREWRQFRDIYPYHVQGVAVSNPRADGSRVVIVAEPPPHLDRNSLTTIFASATSVQFPTQPIGYDGAVRDAVAVIPPTRVGGIGELVDVLHREMFGTTYKAFVLPIEAARTVRDARALDLQVSAADLARWLLPTGSGVASAVRFSRIGAAESLSAREILDTAASGMFMSSRPGVVLCALSASRPLSDARLDLRRFVLDSDLIIGAVRKGPHVIILGRERVAPVAELPPLRVETILQLASVGRDELSQSYERTSIIAGRFDERRDWAPIYLSPALVDTEYGSLLNITDQLLKSWSMSGEVHYERFRYPAPASYPFPKPLLQHVNASQVTFNWNTKGAGYVVASHGVEILALNRTGALPVDYLGSKDNRLLEAEDQGYAYFSSTGDPNLIRVVQYAGLYQVFRRFGIRTAPERPVAPNVTPAAARAATNAMVQALRKFDPDKVSAAIDKAKANPAADAQHLQDLQDLRRAMVGIDVLYKSGGDALLKRLGDALAAPREFGAVDATDEAVIAVASIVMQAPIQYFTRLPLKPIMEQYVRDSARPETNWIRTPSVVVSWSEKADGRPGDVIGGHNLSAKTSSMRADATVPVGRTRIVELEGRRVLLFNPADEPRIASVVRRFGRGEGKSRAVLEAEVNTALRAAPVVERPLAEALAFRPTATGARGLSAGHVPGKFDEVGWHFTDAAPTPVQVETLQAIVDPQSSALLMEYGPNGYVFAAGPGRPVLRAGNVVSAYDALEHLMATTDRPRGAVQLHIRGLDLDQAREFIRGVEGRVPADRRGLFAVSVDDGRLAAGDLQRVFGRDFDFARARVDRVTDAVRTAQGTKFDVHFSVPARQIGRAPLLMRIKLLFRSLGELPAHIKAAAERVVQAWSARFRPGLSPSQLGASVKELKADIRRVHPLLDVEAFIGEEGRDVLITRLLKPGMEWLADAA